MASGILDGGKGNLNVDNEMRFIFSHYASIPLFLFSSFSLLNFTVLMWKRDAALIKAGILIAVSTVTHGQEPIICRGTLFSFLAYLPHYCHLYLPSVWKAVQFKSIHKHAHLNKEHLHTLVPQPVECRATIGRYAGPSQCYHVIHCECGSMLVLRGHSKDQAAPPPLASIVLLSWPLS